MLSHRGGKYWVFLHIYTVIAPMYDPFQEYSVKKGPFVCLFEKNDWKYKQIWRKQFTAYSVYYQNLAKALLMKPRMVCFHLKVIVGVLT